MKKRLSLVILSVILCVSALCSVMFMTTASAAGSNELAATFNLGANGSASHYDGSSKTSYSETNNGYTLNISSGTNMYTGARDAKGNSCIKFGTGSKAGSCTITVPADVVEVKIYVAKYKTNAATVNINNVKTSLTKASNNGEYDVISVNTSSTKTISFAVSSGNRCMMNTIEFYKSGCNHSSTTEKIIKDATCTEDGSKQLVCTSCNKVVETVAIPATGHSYVEGVCTECDAVDPDYVFECEHKNTTTTRVEPTELEAGSITVSCNDCPYIISVEEIPALGCNVSFVVPEGFEAPSSQNGIFTITMPAGPKVPVLSDPAQSYLYDYEFAGWATSAIDGETTTKPTVYSAGETITLEGSMTLYAVYTYTAKLAEGEVGESYWALTDLASINSGATVVITMSNGSSIWAMTNNNGTGSAPTAKAITVSNGKIVGEVPAELKWDLEMDGTNLTFYVWGNHQIWLYCTSTNNGVRVGTNANNTFIIDSSSGYLKHSGTNRFLGVYNAQDWRCYTTNTGSSNIAGQTLGFYVLTQKDTATYYTNNVTVVSCDHSDAEVVTKKATCTEDGSITTTCSCGYEKVEILEKTGHNYTSEVTKAPTCTEDGVLTYTCENCAGSYTEAIEKTGHKFVDGVCHCGEKAPDGEVTFGENGSATHDDGKEIGEDKTYSTGDYTVVLSDMTKVYGEAFDAKGNSCLKLGTEKIAGKFTLTVDKNIGKVVIMVAGYKGNTATVTVNGVEYEITTKSDDGDYTPVVVYTYSTSTISFEVTESNRCMIDSIKLYKKEAPIMNGAGLTAGADLSLNYEVTLPEGDEVSNYVMKFVMNGFEYFVNGELVSGNKYVFKFTGIAPQSIADEVDAYLMCGDEVIVSKEGFSVKKYAECFLAQYGEDPNYKKHITLLGDILAYGEAANDYTGFKPDADFSVDGLGASTVTPDEGDKGGREISASTAEGIEFASAGVRFQYNNKIYVKFDADKDVLLLVNGVEVEFEALGDGTYVYYTDGILATDFDTVYTFELVYNGETVQTLKYSVNAYAISKYQQETPMGKLALALYRYGVSADAIAESAN